jgi:tetratricopeptide (TPR) repeat protein
MQLEPGAVIGARYQIESILGEGGMGTVYKARDIELDRTVALKLVRPELALDPNTMQRFKQELLLARRISHKNILIDRSGTLYVGDFGLAKSFESEDGMKTRTGLILGTPRYMSPEQVEAKPTDGRSDIYSFGIILYEMVTGEAPFLGDSLVKVMYQRVAEPPKNPKSLCPDLPDYLAAIIMRCLERDPEKRYQTAQEILHDLEAEHAPQVTVEAEGTEETWSIPKPKNLGWLMAGGALLVVAMALAIPGSRESLLRWLPAHSPSGASQAKYIALLPFQTVGDDESLKYVAEGVVESLSAKLFQLPNVHLASSAAVDRTDKKQPVEKIARVLGVTYVVKGTLQGTAEKFSAVLDLENVPANHLVWSEEFSGMRQDLLTIEDQIYGKLVAALELKLSNDELARSVSRPTEDIDAYELYLKGQNVLRGQRNVANFTSALSMYDQAINVNPYYWYNYNQLGAAYLRVGENDKALEAFRRVTEIEPEISNGYLNLGIVYYQQGKWNECISAFQKAIARQPSFRAYSNLGVAHFYSGRYREAADMFEKAVAMNPNEHITVGNLADAYRWLGEGEKAAATYDRAIALAYKAYQVNPTDAGTLASLALYYAKMGSRQQAFDFIRRARKIDPNNNALIYDEAVIHALAGQQAEAFTGLHEAFQKGYPPEEAKNDPELQALRSAPQFAKLLQEFHRAP